MKNLVILLLFFSQTLFGQITYIPDSNFEQKLINLGYDNIIDGMVLNSNINTVDTLIISGSYIQSLEGVEGFYQLSYLDCSSNLLDSIDVSSNNLKYFNCSDNQLDEVDVSNSTSLLSFKCNFNNLSTIDISANTSLLYFECTENQLTSLDVSNNVSLNELRCSYNQLTSLDLGGLDVYVLACDNNQITHIDNLSDNVSIKHLSCSINNLTSLSLSSNTDLNWLSCYDNDLTSLDISNQLVLNYFFCRDNPNLYCINVNDVAYANATWQVWNGQTGSIDSHHYFSTNCNPSFVNDFSNTSKLTQIYDINGREINKRLNSPMVYYYENGTVKQILILE